VQPAAVAGGVRDMTQPSFFDFDQRLKAISAKGDPLETIDAAVPWESFRAAIEAVTATKPEERKSNAGRPGYDTILKFKMLVLAALYNLSDESLEFQVRDRLSFMRFLDLDLHDPVPDATTIWLFREELVRASKIGELFDLFKHHLEAKGFIARGGQIIDATIVEAPKQRNSRDENEAVKTGETPEDWEKKPAKSRQKDKDARWTKKHGKSFFGYKNHVGVDKTHKLIRKWDATDAAPHDSQKLDDVLDPSNTSKDVWADSAYRSVEIEQRLKENGYRSRIHRRGARNRPLSDAQEAANKTRSKVRARVEHVFGHQENSMGGKIVRTIGLARARFKIGMMNLGYNICRLVQLERVAAAPS
jgi:transposase, IS5 family